MGKLGIICGTICFVALMGVTLKSCQDGRDKYYIALGQCTGAHGTWIPQGDGSTYTGSCINPSKSP